jgi:uncharacterized membrane protein YphA (DoxX/SURF4 family)
MRLDCQRALATFDALCGREVSSWVYAYLRVGFALLLLARQTSVLAPFLPLEHHGSGASLDFEWSAAREPHLVSPLVPGLALSQAACDALVWLRTALAGLLLLGVRSRWSALGLSCVSYWVMLSDRFQYQHHLHVLYFSILWLALAPLDARLSLERWLRQVPAPSRAPAWPLVLLLAMVASVYLASGSAKLSRTWLSGETLNTLEILGVLKGRSWLVARELLGYAPVAWLVALLELSLPIALALPMTRRAAVACGLLFHGSVSLCMNVSIFGLEMSCLLLAWLAFPRQTAQH